MSMHECDASRSHTQLSPKDNMAKKKTDGVNKSQMIRDYYEANPSARPLEVAAAMQEQGLNVTAQFVSTVKSNSKKSKKTGRRGRPAGSSSKQVPATKATKNAPAAAKRSAASGEVSLDSLLNAKKLINEMGGIENARNALTVLEQLTD